MSNHSIKKLIRNAEKLELTGEQMELITQGRCRIVSYEELEDCKTIDECFAGKEGLIMLYQRTDSNGHWCIIYKQNNNTLVFFDSYGFQMDEELKFSEYNLRKHGGEEMPHLTHLVEESNYKLIQNKVQYQKKLNDINTCGRWTCLRFRMREYTCKEFESLFKGVDGDFYTSALTLLYSNFEY